MGPKASTESLSHRGGTLFEKIKSYERPKFRGSPFSPCFLNSSHRLKRRTKDVGGGSLGHEQVTGLTPGARPNEDVL